MSAHGTEHPYWDRSDVLGFGFWGSILGGFIAYLLRPSAPLVGQLPFESIINQGANLKGLDAVLIPTAETSFNVLLAGAILGTLAGFAFGMWILRIYRGPRASGGD